MNSILEELWYGNVCPNAEYRETTKEAKKLMGYISDHYEEAILIISLQLHPIYTLSFKNRKEIFSYQTYLLYLWRFLCLP